jgi:predicted enzyme related to lactoylglutathione lyase
MANITVARRISPMLAVASMDETIAFYQIVLGFTVTLKTPEYSVIERDGQTIHFQLAASDEVMKCVRDHTEIYIEVSGIQPLWEHVKTFKNRYRIRDLFDREYGMTEFHISDPNSCLVFVAEPTAQLKRDAAAQQHRHFCLCYWRGTPVFLAGSGSISGYASKKNVAPHTFY